jgi:hypothetical protein
MDEVVQYFEQIRAVEDEAGQGAAVDGAVFLDDFPAEGVDDGLVGFAAGFPMNLTLAAWSPIGRVLPLWWMIDLWVGAVLASLVAGWVYKD